MPLPTTWKFYTRTAAAWDAMYVDCAGARTCIDIEQFIFSDDEAGSRFFELLKKKSAEGITIRIVCDAVGSFDLLNSRAADLLKASGIEIVFFNPIQPWRIGTISSWFLRDHRKLLLVDRAIAHTGGAGINARMADWRDTNLRITGPVVHDMQTVFDQIWENPTRYKFLPNPPPAADGEAFSFLVNSPRYRGRSFYHDLRRAIRGSKKFVYLTTPYFVPSILMFTALTRAARRGVDVRILLPTLSDVRTADIAAGSYFLLALNAGIKIYLYDKKRILHAKTVVIDDMWASVGSSNMDNLSLLLNFEGNIRSSDPGFIAAIKQQFIDDLATAVALTKETWIKRPLALKLMELIVWPLHGIL